MNYDKSSFLAGIAVGRQLKGWSGGAGGARQGVGFYYTATGEMELINRQSDSELNYILLPAGLRYCTMYIPNGRMYVFAAAPSRFTMKAYSNNIEEVLAGSGRIVMGGRSYYYAIGEWYSPLPTPLVDCIDPVHASGSIVLTNPEVIAQGMLYLFGGE